MPLYFRFANKYAYATAQDKRPSTRTKLLDPAKVFSPGDSCRVLSVNFRLDQVPEAIKQIGLGQIELRLANEADKKNLGETEAQHALKQLRQGGFKQVAQVIKGGGELDLKVDVDRKTGAALELSLDRQGGTKWRRPSPTRARARAGSPAAWASIRP